LYKQYSLQGLRFGERTYISSSPIYQWTRTYFCAVWRQQHPQGDFDLQSIWVPLSVHGLCLYMHPSKKSGIDMERFAVMLETAKQLNEGLDAYLLDDHEIVNRKAYCSLSPLCYKRNNLL